jgi:RNA polymerase sigma-70 factor (ECF subfamily)
MHIIAKEAQEILENALEQVTKPNHRIAWILRHLEGCSVAEISRILNRKDGTCS